MDLRRYTATYKSDTNEWEMRTVPTNNNEWANWSVLQLPNGEEYLEGQRIGKSNSSDVAWTVSVTGP